MQLRRYKDLSGLSMTALASRTAISRSSWDRYLNGRTVPPARAVEALARACGTEPARLLALHELAAEAPQPDAELSAHGTSTERVRIPEHTVPAVGAEAPPGGLPHAPDLPHPPHAQRSPHPPNPPRSPHASRPASAWPAVVVTSVLTSLLTLLGLMIVAPWERSAMPLAAATAAGSDGAAHPRYTGEPHPTLGEFVFVAGEERTCAVQRDETDGRLYAGYSRTLTEQLQRDATRWSVVEAQCLLRHRGISPGITDGSFGGNTERAVKRLQTRAGIAVDGMVGPDTWKALRA